MNDLTGVATKFVKSMADIGVADLRAKYHFSQVLGSLRHSKVRNAGAEAYVTLAGLLHLDRSALRRLARVSCVIPAEEFEQLATIRLEGGLPLSWSHLEMLAAVHDEPRRRALAFELEGHCMPVRQLATIVRVRASRPKRVSKRAARLAAPETAAAPEVATT